MEPRAASSGTNGPLRYYDPSGTVPGDRGMVFAPPKGVRVVKAEESEKDKKIARLEKEVASLKKRVDALRKEVRSSAAPQVVVLRTLTPEQAKESILAYFDANPGKVVHYDELVRKLRIDLPTVVAVCKELEAEGEIG